VVAKQNLNLFLLSYAGSKLADREIFCLLEHATPYSERFFLSFGTHLAIYSWTILSIETRLEDSVLPEGRFFSFGTHLAIHSWIMLSDVHITGVSQSGCSTELKSVYLLCAGSKLANRQVFCRHSFRGFFPYCNTLRHTLMHGFARDSPNWS
jgi:hypothetical protein